MSPQAHKTQPGSSALLRREKRQILPRAKTKCADVAARLRRQAFAPSSDTCCYGSNTCRNKA
jgi:hypothetical protein